MTYLLELQPLKHFFFGGPNAFEGENHFVSSEYFAQNTQLLGALRRHILTAEKLLKAHKNGLYVPGKKGIPDTDSAKAYALVGGLGKEDLGKIERLSPLFILKMDNDTPADALFPLPLDLLKKNNLLQPATMQRIGGERLPVDYNAKEGTYAGLGGRRFWEDYLAVRPSCKAKTRRYDEVFLPHEQVGIGLDRKEIVKGKFYRKTDYRLAEPYCFGALLRSDYRPQEGLLTLGAENGVFRLRVHELDTLDKMADHPVIQAMWRPREPAAKWVALGEATLDTRDDAIAFAFTPWPKTEKRLDYHTKERHYRFKGKTAGLRLAPRGSVVYLEEPGFPPVAPKHLNRIGYNLFIPIKESTHV
ncbi:type III-B CRISPR module-associated Cmr3 family protein [Hydrogenimonas sp.]